MRMTKHGKVTFDPSFTVNASARRINAEGFWHALLLYRINAIWQRITKNPSFDGKKSIGGDRYGNGTTLHKPPCLSTSSPVLPSSTRDSADAYIVPTYTYPSRPCRQAMGNVMLPRC